MMHSKSDDGNQMVVFFETDNCSHDVQLAILKSFLDFKKVSYSVSGNPDATMVKIQRPENGWTTMEADSLYAHNLFFKFFDWL